MYGLGRVSRDRNKTTGLILPPGSGDQPEPAWKHLGESILPAELKALLPVPLGAFERESWVCLVPEGMRLLGLPQNEAADMSINTRVHDICRAGHRTSVVISWFAGYDGIDHHGSNVLRVLVAYGYREVDEETLSRLSPFIHERATELLIKNEIDTAWKGEKLTDAEIEEQAKQAFDKKKAELLNRREKLAATIRELHAKKSPS